MEDDMHDYLQHTKEMRDRCRTTDDRQIRATDDRQMQDN